MNTMPTGPIVYPPPLRPGDTIAVTAASAPVRREHEGRLDFVVGWLRDRGYDVVEGRCLRGEGRVSAPARERADEFNAFVRDPGVAAIVPPWGGETAIDIVDLLDAEALRACPTWVVGWSDISTLLVPLTLRSGVATVHGQNLMDTPYELPAGTAHWLDVVGLETGETFAQEDPGVRRRGAWDDWAVNPAVTSVDLGDDARWATAPGTGDVDVRGRLVGGCLDVLAHLAGTPYGDVRTFGEASEIGTIVYLENCEAGAFDAARMLHGMRLAGWFDHANAVLIGRTRAPSAPGFTQVDAVLDALGHLDAPIVLDVDFGHVPPGNVLVNGAEAHVVVSGDDHRIVQTLA